MSNFPFLWPRQYAINDYQHWLVCIQHLDDHQKLDSFLSKMYNKHEQEHMQIGIACLLRSCIHNPNPDSFKIILQYLDHIVDNDWEHPLLHEIAQHVGRNPHRVDDPVEKQRINNVNHCFKLLWEHPVYIQHQDSPKYLDKYGLTAKQRLSISCPFDSSPVLCYGKIEEKLADPDFLNYMYEKLGVKLVFERHTPRGRVRIPLKEEYLVESH